MADIDAKLKKIFGKAPALPPAPAPAPEPPKVKLPPKPQKGIADITIAIQAQRIYSPNMPPAPASKAPTTAMLEQGSAPAMDQSGPWGKPEKK
jgi:hypothetical protein